MSSSGGALSSMNSSKKLSKIRTEECMEKKLVTILKKQQLRLIVTKKYITSTNTDENDPAAAFNNFPVYKLEKTNLERLSVLRLRNSISNHEIYVEDDESKLDLTPDKTPKHVQSDSALLEVSKVKKELERKSETCGKEIPQETSTQELPPPVLPVKGKSEASVTSRSQKSSTSLSLGPKEYKCFVSITTTDFSWTDPVQCGDLKETVTKLRELNSNLNQLYIQWQSRLEHLIRNQIDIITEKNTDYFEWCLLKILVQLIEGLASYIPPFFITYSKFQKLYNDKKSFRKNATFSQIRRSIEDGNTMCHFILNAANLKLVMDEYMEDLKTDFNRLHTVIGTRKLIRDSYSHHDNATGTTTSSAKYFPWTDQYSDTTVISFQDSLAIRACKILPWEKLQKKTLKLNAIDETRKKQINKLQLKLKAGQEKANRKKRKGSIYKGEILLIDMKHKYEMKSSLIEYKRRKEIIKLLRRFEWKYYVSKYRGIKYQKHWVINRILVSDAMKLLNMNRMTGLKERYQWEKRNLDCGLTEVKEDYETLINQFNNDIGNNSLLTHEVSLLDIWNCESFKLNVESSCTVSKSKSSLSSLKEML